VASALALLSCANYWFDVCFGNIQSEYFVRCDKHFNENVCLELKVDLLNKYQISLNLNANLQVSSKRKMKIWIFRFSRTTRQISPTDTQFESGVSK
jgi:hypothetical protein